MWKGQKFHYMYYLHVIFLALPASEHDLECYTCCALTIIIALLPWLGALRPLIEPFSQFGKSKDYLIEVAQKLRDARRKENGSSNKVCMYLCMYNVICSLRSHVHTPNAWCTCLYPCVHHTHLKTPVFLSLSNTWMLGLIFPITRFSVSI